MSSVTLWTVVETPSYLSRAEKIFSAGERAEIVTMLASDPECGEVMQGTGGVRKVRVAVGGARQERRRAGDLLLPRQRVAADPNFRRLHEERKSEPIGYRKEQPREAHAGDQSAREVARHTKGTTSWRARRFELSKLG
jgi:hypothetical protein